MGGSELRDCCVLDSGRSELHAVGTRDSGVVVGTLVSGAGLSAVKIVTDTQCLVTCGKIIFMRRNTVMGVGSTYVITEGI